MFYKARTVNCRCPLLLALLAVGTVAGCDPPARPATPAPTGTATAADSRAAAIPAFLAWAREHGARLDPRVRLERIPGFGLGLRTTAPIAAGERYLTFDPGLLIGREQVLADPRIGAALGRLDPRMQQDTRLLLTLFLLHHRFVQGSASRWWPFLQVLPREYRDSPMFQDDAALAVFDGSYLREVVRRERARHRRRFEHLRREVFARVPALFPAERIGDDEYLWGVWTTNSRLFFIEGLTPREHLLPLADMVNCAEPPERQDLRFAELGPGSGQVQLRADRDFAAGEQVFESYGFKSNLELLLFEGFLLPDSPNDCVWLEASPAAAPDAEPRRPRWLCVGARELRRGRVEGRALDKLRRLARGPSASVAADDRPVLALLQAAVQRGLERNRFSVEDRREDLGVRFRVLEKRQLLALAEAITGALGAEGPLHLSASPTSWPKPGARAEPVGAAGPPAAPGAGTSPEAKDEAAAITGDGPLPSRPKSFDLGGFCPGSKPGCLRPKTEALNRWAREQGAELLVEARPAPGMRVGAFATAAITPGAAYIRMPDAAILDATDAERADIAPLLAGAGARERLLLLLLHEARQGAASRFAPYLDSLPESFEDVPITWGREELAGLAGTGARRAALKQRRDLLKQYDAFRRGARTRHPDAFGWVTFDDFVWASLVLSTRCIWWDRACHLVPVLDMINCSEGPGPAPYPPHRTEADPAASGSVTRAQAAFAPGEQVFENYGQPNFHYVATHGFLLEDNSHDAVPVNLGGRRLLLGPRRLDRALQVVGRVRLGEAPREVLAGLVRAHLESLTGGPRVDALVAEDDSQPWHVRLAAQLRTSQRRTLGSLGLE